MHASAGRRQGVRRRVEGRVVRAGTVIVLIALTGLTATALPAPARAATDVPPDAAALSLRALAATCANCHGTEGRPADAAMPPLAGLPRGFIAAQMRAFRAGERPATVMHQISRGYTEAQIDALAGYFAALPGPAR